MIRREDAQFEFGAQKLAAAEAGRFGVKEFSGQGALRLRGGFQ
jgi:hypothetical protein